MNGGFIYYSYRQFDYVHFVYSGYNKISSKSYEQLACVQSLKIVYYKIKHMNREIKFRTWDKKERKMHYATDENCWWVIYLQGSIHYPDGGFVDVSKKAVLMQFTGLKDRNGREIYEGDIVEWSIYTDPQDLGEGESEEKRITDAVAYGNGCWKAEKRCEILGLKEPYRKLEVVGNIYENPELLSQGESKV